MDLSEAQVILDEALARIGEHFDCVQIHASWLEDGGQGTFGIHRGTGNFYARQALSREFVIQNAANELAQSIGRELKPNP